MRTKTAGWVAMLVVTLTPGVAVAQQDTGQSGRFERRVIATGLGNPYEIQAAKDSSLWLTEKTGLRVLRMDPATGRTQTALDLHGVAAPSTGQDGLLGLALQERSGRVVGAYVSYTYPTGGGLALRIVHYATSANGVTLVNPRTLLEGLPAFSDHQGGRLRLGPDGMLYYSIGDQAKNRTARTCTPNEAQRLPIRAEVTAHDWSAYEGKTLRLTTTGGIPRDNPVLEGVRSHVYTYGFRNQQGLDFGPVGRLYGSEQGPSTDDEVNLLHPGGNYGWPYVAGYRDDKAYVYANWSKASPTPCEKLTYNDNHPPKDVPQQKETDWQGATVDPVDTLGTTVESGYDFEDPACAAQENLCWPTIGPTSLTTYDSDTIPGWKGSLLITAQKTGQVYRVSTDPSGTRTTGVEKLWTAPDRYRDIAVSPDGGTVYVATDQTGNLRVGGEGPITGDLQDRGAILAYTFVNR